MSKQGNEGEDQLAEQIAKMRPVVDAAQKWAINSFWTDSEGNEALSNLQRAVYEYRRPVHASLRIQVLYRFHELRYVFRPGDNVGEVADAALQILRSWLTANDGLHEKVAHVIDEDESILPLVADHILQAIADEVSK